MTLPELAIRRHVTTLMLLTSLAVLGSVAITRLPLAFLPDMEEPELFIHLPYPSASPEQVERMVARPVEEVVGGIRGLQQMWTRCDDEGARIRLEFDWSTDMHVARVDVWEKIDRIRQELPDDVEDITVTTNWNTRESDAPILEARLASQLDLAESYDLLERRVMRPLQRVPGVAQVRLDGVSPREVRIDLRLSDLEAHAIDVREVSRLLRSSNFDQSLGVVRAGERRFLARTIGAFRSVEEIGDVVLRRDGLRLRDVADVVYEEPELEFGRHLDGNVAVGLTVSAEAKANVVEVCDALEARIAEMSEDPELAGLEFLVWESQGREIRKSLRELFVTGVVGAVLASLVLFAFLRRLSTTLISVMCIPFSLVVTCGFIWLQGKTMNTLTLLGLIVGIGMLVDNAVVVMENIFRFQEMGHGRKDAARLGAREVSTAVIAATLTSVIVFLPLVFNRPNEMTIPLTEIGLTVCWTLLASLFISQTLIPLATSWFIRSQPRPRERWMSWLERRYLQLLDFNLRHRWVTPVIGAAVIASAIHPYGRVDQNFGQDEPETYVTITYHFSEEVTLDAKEEIITRVERALQPHREALFTKSLYSWWSDGFTMTRIYVEDDMATEEDLRLVRARTRKVLPEIPGVRLEVPEGQRSWRHEGGKRIGVRLVGEEMSVLAELAEEARVKLAATEGLVGAFASNQEGQMELHLDLDRRLLARYDVSSQGLADKVGLTFRGRRLPRFRTPDGEREMRLTLEERERHSVTRLHQLPLWSEDGAKLPLAALATFRSERAPERIERDDGIKGVWVGASYERGTREEHVEKVVGVIESLDFPRGYSWTFGDWEARQRERTREFLVNIALALLLVFAVMASLFESTRQAIALTIALPFALAGAMWSLYLSGKDLDQPAAVGILLLIGVVVNNGIVMLEHINSYRRAGMAREDAMRRGGRERLRPILMTALTTLLGLLPIVIQRPALGGFYYYSMALVIMGGMLVSTFLTLVLLPTTVTLVEDGMALCGRGLARAFRAFYAFRGADAARPDPEA